MKIVTYNVNGIRAAINKGLLNWMRDGDFDIVCLQETKAQPEDLKPEGLIEELGYHTYWHSAVKKGYSGVAIFSKNPADQVIIGCKIDDYDLEGRIIRADFGDFTLLNCYFPSGTTGELRQSFKMKFLDDFFIWAHDLKTQRPNLIVTGDYNIAHQEIDIHNPKSNKKSSGFLPEERAWMTKWLESGFIDSFRFKYPDKVEYSWWSSRPGVRAKNLGWRIDYFCIADILKEKIIDCGQFTDVVHSDHCPVFLEISL